MFPDVYENRQRQGIGGGGDEDQIPGDPTVPIMCRKYQGIGTVLKRDSSSAVSVTLCPGNQRKQSCQGTQQEGILQFIFKPTELVLDQ